MHPKIAPFFQGREQFYPQHLESKYGRIFNKIIGLWGSNDLNDFFNELLIDDRGGRQGFPPDVLNDILTLSGIHNELTELKIKKDQKALKGKGGPEEDIWANDIARRELKKEQLDFSIGGFFRTLELENIRALQLFLSAGVKVEMKNTGGWTPLIFCASLGKVNASAALIGAGANVNAVDPQGYTPLHWAAFRGFPNMIQLLVEKGANVNAKSDLDLTPLLQAAVWGHAEIVGYLLSKGAFVNAADNEGWTPLHRAVSDGHVKVVKQLMAAGADPNAQNGRGLTPIMIAKQRKNPEIIAAVSK